MDRSPPPLFRQVAVEAAAGSQIGGALKTRWPGVRIFTATALLLTATLIAFAAGVGYSPVHRFAAVVDVRNPPARVSSPLDGRVAPTADPLTVTVLVAADAAAALRPGTAFKLAFPAYPRERFGLFAARIDSIGTRPSMPRELPQAAAASEPMYVATATMPSGARGPHGEVLALEPGMLAEALVPIEERSLLAWLLDPIRRRLDPTPSPAAAALPTEPPR